MVSVDMPGTRGQEAGSQIPLSRIREIKKCPLRRWANHWHWSAHPGPPKGTLRIVTTRWAGMRWTQLAAGDVSPGEPPAAYGEVVWSWRRDRGVYFAGGYPADNGDNQRRSPGRSRISRQTIARGKPGCLGCTCLIRVRLSTIAHGAAGAASARLSLRPLFRRGTPNSQNPGENLPRERGSMFSPEY